MARGSLLAAIEATNAGGFVADTAPIIYRLERRAAPRLVAAVDPVFDAVDRGELGCIISAISAAELLIGPFRAGPAAVSTVDRFLRQPMLGIAEVDERIARGAARAIAEAKLMRLPDALIAATARVLTLPLVTGDRRLSRAGVATGFFVHDYTSS